MREATLRVQRLVLGGVLVGLTVGPSVGCLDRQLGVIEPRIARGIDVPVTSDGVPDVDLMLVIDDSGSMREEQALLEREIPSLVRGLTSPPDEDGDGAPDWNAAESVRVAIVTTDLGTAGEPETRLSGCGLASAYRDPWGRDGRFRSDTACDPSGSGVHAWQRGDDVDAFVERVSCVARAGTTGCGFEQPLASAARALARASETGFPRAGALLAVLVLTDEEDCSLADPASFFAGLPLTPGAANGYCVTRTDALATAESIAAELSADRDPSRFVFAAIAGVPVDLVGVAPDAVLADARMQYLADSGAETGLRPACTGRTADGAIRSNPTPARRLVELAARLPDALVRSICEDDFRPAIAELTRRIGSRITGACLGRALVPDEHGAVPCTVEETLPLGTRCADLPGRTFVTALANGREQCLVVQAPGGAGSGWYYDAADARCDRIALTPDAVPPFGATLRFQCLVELPPGESPVGP